MWEKKETDHKLMRLVMIKQTLGQKQCLQQSIDPYHAENPFNIPGLEAFLSTREGKELTKALKHKLQEYNQKYKPL